MAPLAQYYAYYACSGGSTTPVFYSNTNPAFSTPPPAFIKITSDSTLDPDLLDQCFHMVILNAQVPPSPLESITWLTATYETYSGCDDCLSDNSAIILENCDDPLDVVCLQPSAAGFIGYYTQYNNKCYVVKEVPDCTANAPISYSFAGNIFKTCVACKQTLPAVTYKLTNCNEPYDITYTSTDLFELVGSVIQINDFEDCFYVEVVQDSIPGIDVAITGGPFQNCEDCSADYYILTDCRSIEDPIITTTNLFDYIGEVIVIEGCPDTCWQVQPTDPAPNPITVTVAAPYGDCPECLAAILPCRCQSAVSQNLLPGPLRYINCSGDESSTAIIPPGQRSNKYCVLYWISGTDIEDYGLCSEDTINQTWTCPPTPAPKRKVTPGYNTPACSTDYYEKVECNFSEWMYKDALQKRYGISNCCPEDLMKWEIKHEMLMLDVLVNPDYVCTVASDCHCPEIGTASNAACVVLPKYLLERCDNPEITEVVRIDDTYNVLGSVITINDFCYTVTQLTNRLVTVYWTPGTIYENCVSAGCATNYRVQRCCTDIQYWTLPNGELTDFAGAIGIGDCEDFVGCYREMRDELIVYACGGQGVPSDLWTYEIQPCGTKAIKSIEPRCTGYYWYFVQNSDSTLTVYAVEDDGFGNYTIYTDTLTNSEACCGADYMTSLTNNDPGIIPSGPCQGVYTGIGFFDWFNRLIDLFNDDQNLHFYPYYDVETDQCLVDQTDYVTEVVTITNNYNVLNKVIKDTSNNCYKVLSIVTSSPTIQWKEPEIYEVCAECQQPS